MTDDHQIYADWAAAYTLGALDAEDRKDFEQHLPGCEICTADLASFAPLPGLIAKVEPGDLGPRVDSPLASNIEVAARREIALNRRRNRRWRVAALVGPVAAGLLVVLLFTALDDDGPPAPETRAATIVDSDVENAFITTSARLWGTEVTVELDGLPARDSYQVWTVDTAGTWASAASWLPTPSGRARLTGASSTQASDIERIVVTSQDRSEILVDARA